MCDADRNILQSLYDVYCELYEDQLEGADDVYLDYFESNFAPPCKPWDNEEDAKSAFRSLLDELYNDRTDVTELLEMRGFDKELIQRLRLFYAMPT